MTNHWVDIKNADLILIMGGNAAEAHPCGFKWVTEAKAHNKARLIVVDPRFTRSASVADYYAPIRPGTDIVFLGGLINYLLANDKIQRDYVVNYTDLSFIVKEEFAFTDGIYSGYNVDKRTYDKSSWDYELGADGYAKVDPTLQHPRCVYNLLKAHYSRYVPEMVERVCGTPKDKVLHIWEMIATTATPTRAMTIMYALGWTQHSIGSQMMRTGAMVQLLLGNIGVSGGGMNALRGHSNIQGLTDLGLLSNQLPAYISLPSQGEQEYAKYLAARTLKPLRPNQLSYWQNTPKFFVSFMKTWGGHAATERNNSASDYLPKLDKPYAMRGAQRFGDHGRHFYAHARHVFQGWRCLSGPHSQLDLEIRASSKSQPGRARQRILGQCAQRLGRSQRSDQDHAQGRRAARGLRRAARRRQHPIRVLDFLRSVGPHRQPDGSA